MDPVSIDEAIAAAGGTRRLVTGSGVLKDTAAVFREVCPGRSAVVISDDRCQAAAGSAVHACLQAAGVRTLPPFTFASAGLVAESGAVDRLVSALGSHQAVPVVTGSGTLNDLTKLAAHRAQRPYVCVATAASMDGYTAFGASITHRGSKQTFDCPAPIAVVADIDVIRRAPDGMNAWGYADLCAKLTAGADWLLADRLGEEPLDSRAWGIVQNGLLEAVNDPAGIRAGDEEATRRLVDGLMLGGFAMQLTRTSRPASGAEHQFSHLWDMQHHTHHGRIPSHGFKVGIGTLAVTALYEALFDLPLSTLDVEARVCQWPEGDEWLREARRVTDNPGVCAVAVREIHAKQVTPGRLGDQLKALAAGWPAWRDRLRGQLLPFDELRRRLSDAGAPIAPEAIGITRSRLRESFRQAFFIRRRFTVLDLAVRAGVLDACLNRIFGPQGRWPLVEETAVSR